MICMLFFFLRRASPHGELEIRFAGVSVIMHICYFMRKEDSFMEQWELESMPPEDEDEDEDED